MSPTASNKKKEGFVVEVAQLSLVKDWINSQYFQLKSSYKYKYVLLAHDLSLSPEQIGVVRVSAFQTLGCS